MRKSQVVAAISAVALSVGLLSGCGTNNTRDQENISATDPDYAENFNNGDQYPNITLVCIRGVGFATTTRTGAGSWREVPEWNKFCQQFNNKPLDKGQLRKNG
jgi:hypothetical protein